MSCKEVAWNSWVCTAVHLKEQPWLQGGNPRSQQAGTQKHSTKITSSPLGTSVSSAHPVNSLRCYVSPHTLAENWPIISLVTLPLTLGPHHFHTQNFHSLFNYFSSPGLSTKNMLPTAVKHINTEASPHTDTALQLVAHSPPPSSHLVLTPTLSGQAASPPF